MMKMISFDYFASKLQLFTPIKKMVKLIPFPFIYGLPTSFAYFELKRTQWLRRHEIEEIQNKRLRAIVKFAYHYVPFYHKKMRELNIYPTDIKKKRDIKKLPILHREDIIKNYRDLLSRYYKIYGGRINYTGGTTGSPVPIMLSGKTMGYKRAIKLRFYETIDLRHGEKIAYLRPPPSLQKDPSCNVVYEFLDFNNSLYLSNYKLSDEIIKKHIMKLNEFKPKAISGTPSTLYVFARYILENNIELSSVKKILSTSETLYPYQRRVIEDAFGCDIFEDWGQGEMVGAAFECKVHGFHLCEEIGIVEFIKDNEDVSAGEEGEVIGTSLINKSMPLIRYYIGDTGVPSDEKCSCGRGLPIIKRILGKTRENIITKSGKRIPGEIFTWVVMKQDWIKESQIVQTSLDKLIIKVVPLGEITKEREKKLIEQIKNIIGYEEDMEICIEYVDEIYPTKAGKRPFVISKVKK